MFGQPREILFAADSPDKTLPDLRVAERSVKSDLEKEVRF
jgi:hypothetical protein